MRDYRKRLEGLKSKDPFAGSFASDDASAAGDGELVDPPSTLDRHLDPDAERIVHHELAASHQPFDDTVRDLRRRLRFRRQRHLDRARAENRRPRRARPQAQADQ